MTLYPHQENILRSSMTTQTQPDPKPQLWRDLDKDDRVTTGDRLTGGGGSSRWQRPVTPGQCDCAELREALEESLALNINYHETTEEGQDFSDARNVIRQAKAALSQPHTCAGKSADISAFQFQHKQMSEQENRDIETIADLRRKLAEAEKELPETFFAGLPFIERLRRMVEHWRGATLGIQKLEQEQAHEWRR